MPRRASVDPVKAAVEEGVKVGRAKAEAKRVKALEAAENTRRAQEKRNQAEEKHATALHSALSQIPFRKDFKVVKRPGSYESGEYESSYTHTVHCTFVEVGRELSQWDRDRTKRYDPTNGKEIMFKVQPDGFELFHVAREYEYGAAKLELEEHKKFTDPVVVVRAVAEWAAKRGLLAPET